MNILFHSILSSFLFPSQMRSVLLIVALAALVAMVSAQATGSYTLKGSFYTTTDCTGTANAVSFTYSSTSTAGEPCVQIGSGSTGWALEGFCYNYNLAGANFQYWYVYAYGGYTCPSSGYGTPTGTGSNYWYAIGSDFSTKVSFSYITACFQPSACSSASTLIVPSFLLAALAFAASKLSL